MVTGGMFFFDWAEGSPHDVRANQSCPGSFSRRIARRTASASDLLC